MAPYRILVGVDFSDTASLALAEAAALALARPPAELHAVCVLEGDAAVRTRRGDVGAGVEDTAEMLRSAVAEQVRSLRGDGGKTEFAVRVFVHVRLGSPVEEIATLGADIGADLIVLGTHGRRGLQRLWLGSVAERVVRVASCPVLVVREKTEAGESAAFQPEPACPDCAARRAATDGQEWWCARHTRPLEDAHHFAYSSAFDYTAQPYNKVW